MATREVIEDYAERFTQEEPEILRNLNRETHQKVMRARMISGHLQGRLLSLVSHLIKPKNILEIGTYTGYSALCLSEGMHEDGLLHTIDNNEELYDLQRKYFDKSPYGKQIVQHVGAAITIIPKLEDGFDLVFIDADKKNYSNYFDAVLPKIKSGGILISDNVLWYGKVVEPTQKDDKDTALLKEYNQKLHEDNRVENVLLPIRDGLYISRKI